MLTGIGQTLNGRSREYEHQTFCDALRNVIVNERVDALIIAGDVFDGINPSVTGAPYRPSNPIFAQPVPSSTEPSSTAVDMPDYRLWRTRPC